MSYRLKGVGYPEVWKRQRVGRWGSGTCKVVIEGPIWNPDATWNKLKGEMKWRSPRGMPEIQRRYRHIRFIWAPTWHLPAEIQKPSLLFYSPTLLLSYSPSIITIFSSLSLFFKSLFSLLLLFFLFNIQKKKKQTFDKDVYLSMRYQNK